MTGPVDSLPLVAFVPLQAPLATQPVVLFELQVSVDVAPLATAVGEAASDTVGVVGVFTLIVVLLDALLAALEQVRMKVDVADSGPTVCTPLLDLLPLHAPLAVQPVAPVEVQLKVEVPPLATVPGELLRLTVTGAVTATYTDRFRLPPMPVQVRVKVDEDDSGPTVSEPFIALLPLQSPLAVQLVALVEVQLSVE